MSPELAALAATAFIQLAAVVWSQRALEADIGHDGNTGTREHLDERLSEHSKRLRRALVGIGILIVARLFDRADKMDCLVAVRGHFRDSVRIAGIGDRHVQPLRFPYVS